MFTCVCDLLSLSDQELEVGLHWVRTSISGWKSTWVDGHKSPLLLRKVAMAALTGRRPTCWCSATQDTTGNSIDRKAVEGWVLRRTPWTRNKLLMRWFKQEIRISDQLFKNGFPFPCFHQLFVLLASLTVRLDLGHTIVSGSVAQCGLL